jgi:hypothetical protein
VSADEQVNGQKYKPHHCEEFDVFACAQVPYQQENCQVVIIVLVEQMRLCY